MTQKVADLYDLLDLFKKTLELKSEMQIRGGGV